jgi:hypothetical protein
MGAVAAREAPKSVLAPGFRMENRVTAGADEIYYGERALVPRRLCGPYGHLPVR